MNRDKHNAAGRGAPRTGDRNSRSGKPGEGHRSVTGSRSGGYNKSGSYNKPGRDGEPKAFADGGRSGGRPASGGKPAFGGKPGAKGGKFGGKPAGKFGGKSGGKFGADRRAGAGEKRRYGEDQRSGDGEHSAPRKFTPKGAGKFAPKFSRDGEKRPSKFGGRGHSENRSENRSEYRSENRSEYRSENRAGGKPGYKPRREERSEEGRSEKRSFRRDDGDRREYPRKSRDFSDKKQGFTPKRDFKPARRDGDFAPKTERAPKRDYGAKASHAPKTSYGAKDERPQRTERPARAPRRDDSYAPKATFAPKSVSAPVAPKVKKLPPQRSAGKPVATRQGWDPASAANILAEERAANPSQAGAGKALVSHDEDGSRVDRWFSRRYPGLTHGMLEKMLRTGQIRVNGKRIRAKDRLSEDDEVRLPPQVTGGKLELKPQKKVAQKMDGSLLQEQVIYMDGNVLVINKPSGLATQGGSGLNKHVDGMLDDLMFDKKTRPKLVHRLDKDTSGVLVIARNAASAATLSKSLADRDANKIYWALTKGIPKPRRGVIKGALAKEGGHGPHGTEERMVIAEDSNPEAKAASTAYAVMGTSGEYAWVACKPLTGRTHQIRVHLASIGTPIVGDFKYGGTNARGHGELIDQLHLHARSIDMAAPDQVRLHAVADLPEHMLKAWKQFGFDPDNQEDPFTKVRGGK